MFDHRNVSVLKEEKVGDRRGNWPALEKGTIKGFPTEMTQEQVSEVWVMKQKYSKRGMYEKDVR